MKLPLQVRVLGQLRAESEQSGRDDATFRPEFHHFSLALNGALNKNRKKNLQQFVAVRPPLAELQGNEIVIELDNKNEPIPVDQIQAKKGKSSVRKIIVNLDRRSHRLTDSDGGKRVRRPRYRLTNLLFKKAGYEVIVVDPYDTDQLLDEVYCECFAKNLAERITSNRDTV